jgi:hypothetical protein
MASVPTPKFKFFDLVQNQKSGKFFVITKIEYSVQKTFLGELKGYSFKYNDGNFENDLVLALNSPEVQNRGILEGSKLFPEKEEKKK